MIHTSLVEVSAVVKLLSMSCTKVALCIEAVLFVFLTAYTFVWLLDFVCYI